MTRVTGDPSVYEEVINFVKSEVIPRAKESGATHGYWLLDRNTGKSGTLVLYDSEQQMRETAAAMAQIRENAAQRFGVTFDTVEEFEVVAEL